MTKTFRRKMCLVAFAVASAATLPLRSDVIFDNSTTDLQIRFAPTTFQSGGTSYTHEVGDEIILANTGYLTNFSFEYYAVGGAQGGAAFVGTSVQARVRFYAMDGPVFNADPELDPNGGYPTPDRGLFDSGWFSVPEPTTRNTFVFGAQDLGTIGIPLLENNMTWSVQFRGFGLDDQLGVDLYSLPTVGQDYRDYWRKVGGSWLLEEPANGVPRVDFGARFEATIPEPSAVTLLLVGGVGAFLARRRK